MAEHLSLAQGGNQFAWPTDPIGASATGYVNVRPAEHHMRREYTIENHVNTGYRPFRSTEGENLYTVKDGDTFDTHLVGAPALITGVSVHLREGLDTTAGSKFSGVGAKISVWLEGQDDSDTRIDFINPFTGGLAEVDMTKPGQTYFFVPKVVSPQMAITQPGTDVITEVPAALLGKYLNQDQVLRLMWKYDGTLPEVTDLTEVPDFTGCFGVVLHYTWLEDDGRCDCTRDACPSEYPEPICTPRP